MNKDRYSYFEETIEAIEALDVFGQEDGDKRNALQWLAKVSYRPVTDCEQTKLNIHDIEKAINSLLGIESIDTGDIRLQLDTLLSIEQGRCYFYE